MPEIKDLLPIGSVVLLEDADTPLMICGVFQTCQEDEKELNAIIAELNAVNDEIRRAKFINVGAEICVSRLDQVINNLNAARRSLAGVRTYH